MFELQRIKIYFFDILNRSVDNENFKIYPHQYRHIQKMKQTLQHPPQDR